MCACTDSNHKDTEPAQRPGISAPGRSPQTPIVHRVQKSNAAEQAITIETAVGEFAHSGMIRVNSRAGLFFVMTTSLELVACSGLYSDIPCVLTELSH